MELIRGLYNLKIKHQHCVTTIGNFDGVHIGHQKIIQDLTTQANLLNLPSCIINFEPYPQEFFSQDQAPARLSRLTDKIKQYKKYNIQQLLLLKFNQHLRNLTAEAFVKQILVDGLGIRHLLIGDDFKFGKGRTGNFELLKKLGKDYGFNVSNTHTIIAETQRISSTRIRQCLASGDLTTTTKLLGRPYSICSHVIHGAKRGRTIGFPTANLPILRKKSPIHGVFAVQSIIDGKLYNGVANVGKRPTVNGVDTLLEVHFFDLDKNLYGKMLQVDILLKIRDEQKFDSFDLLKQQIINDSKQAKAFFKDTLNLQTKGNRTIVN